MYGRLEGELRFNRWHMWLVPSSSKSSVAASENSFVFIDTNSFSKDGRKVNVGDCALFKPLNSSLPFVGRIRKLIAGKESSSPSLSVNWLYRPADVKLKEGALLNAAPNEIFYSFHEDEIPAASLLHPCKVTFFRKGVELPSGLFSFVCRRVYDIEGECLWWLTDKDYINERQEEVNQLLDKTQIEMYGTSHPGGRSPKPMNGPNGTPQSKPSSDNVQNSSSSISSHAKSKKREHGVHNSDSVKRERLSKVEDADSGQRRSEYTIKTEIAKITDKGGLVDLGAVEKLIQLMRPNTVEKKLDLASKAMLVDVISVTDRFDCLSRFVQLRGLAVLDEWLQEIHKGKLGDGISKVNDKSVEEFLFSLLRALDKLPVNLHALQTCNVGKSVNHLRSHKNSEIQNKARSLVSTWKRRVEAEMNVLETKSGSTRGGGSWPNKSMAPEGSPIGSRRIEVGPKSSTSQPLKSQQSKVNNNSGEPVAKSPTSPVSTKLSPSSATKDGRSCSSSQSPNNSQSCSSDHNKNSTNGFHASTVPVAQKEVVKVGCQTPIRHASEKTSDLPLLDNGNSPRLIVRLPNTGRSPARTVSVGSPEDSSAIPVKGSVQVSSEKPNQKVLEKSESLQGNTGLSQGKDGLGGHSEEQHDVTNGGHEERLTEAGSGSSKTGKFNEASYSSINALVESCVKFSEASVSPPVCDDVGMNLLASVAAGEMSRSDVSPVCSPESNSPLPEDSCSVNVAKLRQITQDEDNVKTDEDNTVSDIMAPDAKPLKEDTSGLENADKNDVVQSDAGSIREKVESQNKDESGSWSSSSDMHEDEKKMVNKRLNSSNLATTSHSNNVDIAPKSEDTDKKTGTHGEKLNERLTMDSSTSVLQRCNEHSHVKIEKDEKAPAVASQEVRSTEKPNIAEVEVSVKLDFDLNEVFPNDDGTQGEVERSPILSPSTFPSYNSPVMGNRSGLITVASAAKGPFYPSENLLRGKTEIGWKGSAATSAFRPAEPRKSDVPVSVPVPDSCTSKQARPLLDFDLNVGVVEDTVQNITPSTRFEAVGHTGRLNLDLNACEDADISSSRPSIPLLSGRPNSSMDFDLNNGPGMEEIGGESVSFSKNSMPFMSNIPNVRMNSNMDMVNFSTWYPPNNTYPAITIPSVLPGPSQRMFTPVTASTSSHNPEIFRGPVLSSSPAVPFQYSSFPFETNFSMPSVSNTFSSVSTAYVDTSLPGGPLCFPTLPPSQTPQLVGPNGAVSMPYRPYFMSLPGGSSNVGPDGRKWPSHGLDLNAGTNDNKLPSGFRPIPIGGSQSLADEQLKMFQQQMTSASSGISKRKEPDGGWDGDRLSYKHPSWQ
ncbi:uncharacterized protein [Rutidosis leptorrhynchoides]|uniref:uncharacterized protein isoform X2 n=1 Tax=Rutidosis leptorrhynchoides TaxID=125765 RepID=UPI003A9A6068